MKSIILNLGHVYVNTRKARELKRKLEFLDFFRSGGIVVDNKNVCDFYTYRRDSSLTVVVDTCGELITNISIM